jgi:hypothetical protein
LLGVFLMAYSEASLRSDGEVGCIVDEISTKYNFCVSLLTVNNVMNREFVTFHIQENVCTKHTNTANVV